MLLSKLRLDRYRSVMSETSIAAALTTVRENIAKSHLEYCKRTGTESRDLPCLIAVSKTKPVQMIEEAYGHQQRDFGENYVKELVEKGKEFDEKEGYGDIRWHFIGKLQRNKVNNLLETPNLECIQTVESIKLASAINNSCQRKGFTNKMKVFAQVKSSGEESKSGCLPGECSDLVRHIINTCDRLQFEGLMTIGSFSHDYQTGPNPDFECLNKCRDQLESDLLLNKDDIKLSMGMSNDYQEAILAGANAVRVGSTVFGKRDYPPT